MEDDVLDLGDLGDFFEKGYDVTSMSDTQWLFTATSGKFAGLTVELDGSGFTGTGDFPDAGTITHVIVTGPDGVISDTSDLSLPVATLLDESDHGHGGGQDDTVIGGDDDNDLHGHGGDDDLSGGGGDDHLAGGGGDDDLSGDDGDDHLAGGGGDDHLSGGDGNDKLVGQGGKDILHGDAGDDVLKGQGKGDLLDGGEGDDKLDGGGGNDVFVFGTAFGNDIIKRFDIGHDKIDLSATGLTFADLAITESHGDEVITTSQGTITIDKLTHGDHLSESDFLF